MTLLPMNARSEFVTPWKWPVDGLFESRRTFHAASAAGLLMTRRDWPSITTESVVPGMSPTRGSGLGGSREDDDCMTDGDGFIDEDVDDELQAAKTNAAADAVTIGRATRPREAKRIWDSGEGADDTNRDEQKQRF